MRPSVEGIEKKIQYDLSYWKWRYSKGQLIRSLVCSAALHLHAHLLHHAPLCSTYSFALFWGHQIPYYREFALPTNGRTDGRTNGRTHPLIEMWGASRNESLKKNLCMQTGPTDLSNQKWKPYFSKTQKKVEDILQLFSDWASHSNFDQLSSKC